jgi:hypothetical protein
MGNLFYGLLAHLSDALERPDNAALESVLARNLFADVEKPDVVPLAAYVRTEADRLAGLPATMLMAGRLKESAAA